MTMDNPPCEDAFPIENGEFPIQYLFSGVYIRSTPHPVTVTNEGL